MEPTHYEVKLPDLLSSTFRELLSPQFVADALVRKPGLEAALRELQQRLEHIPICRTEQHKHACEEILGELKRLGMFRFLPELLTLDTLTHT